MHISNVRKEREGSYLFKFLLLANMCMYLEAGAIPALLLQISASFAMPSGKQGMLGGVAYLSLGLGSPFAAFLLRQYDHKTVISYAIGVNSICTFFWALTPIGLWYSTALFIGIRFIMGLMQCILCVYLPLWVHEFAPPSQRAKWMGALQSSVPFGVMIGYIIAAVLVGPISGTDTCFHFVCWRWPLLFEWALLFPFCIAIHFVPSRHFAICDGDRLAGQEATSNDSTSKLPKSYNTFPPLLNHYVAPKKFNKIDNGMKAQSFAVVESKVNRQQTTEESEESEEVEFENYITRRNSWHNEPQRSSLYASLFTALSPSSPKYVKKTVADGRGDDIKADIECVRLTETSCENDMDENKKKRTNFLNYDIEENMACSTSVKLEYDADADEDAETFSHFFYHLSDNEASTSDDSSLRPVLILLQIPLYRSLLCALTALYFVVTGVQFWSTSYMVLLFGTKFRPLIDTMFIFCAATAPTGGVLVGSWVVDELGGYCGNKQRNITLRICTVSGIFGCLFATLAVLTSDIWHFSLYLWLLLFSGGCILPAASGILLSIVPHKYRTISSSFTLMTCNIFGYFLSLCVSGYIMEVASSLIKDCDETCAHIFGYHVILLWSFLSFFFLTYALFKSPYDV